MGFNSAFKGLNTSWHRDLHQENSCTRTNKNFTIYSYGLQSATPCRPVVGEGRGVEKLYPRILYLDTTWSCVVYFTSAQFNPLSPELNPICYLLALLLAHYFLHVSRIRVKSLTFRRLMSYIYGAPILDVSRSHTTTQHSR